MNGGIGNQPAVYSLQDNANDRAIFLGTALDQDIELGTFGPLQPGATLTQQLQNVGVLQGVLLRVQGSIDITAAATKSKRGPWNFISRVTITDFNTTTIVNADGDQIQMIESIKQQKLQGFGVTYSIAPAWSEPLTTIPSFPTGVANNQDFEFFLYIPIAYHPQIDQRGALLMQSITGSSFINITLNPSFFGTDDDSVYSAGTGTYAGGFNITMYQIYKSLGNVPSRTKSVPLPPGAPPGFNMSGAPIMPLMDFGTIYELIGGTRITSNIANNAALQLNYPNLRQVLSMYLRFVNGGAMAYGNLAKIQQVGQASQFMQTWDEPALRHEFLRRQGWDLPPASWYISSRKIPINTQIYGNMQLWVTPQNVAAGNTYIAPHVESFYTRGQALASVA